MVDFLSLVYLVCNYSQLLVTGRVIDLPVHDQKVLTEAMCPYEVFILSKGR